MRPQTTRKQGEPVGKIRYHGPGGGEAVSHLTRILIKKLSPKASGRHWKPFVGNIYWSERAGWTYNLHCNEYHVTGYLAGIFKADSAPMIIEPRSSGFVSMSYQMEADGIKQMYIRGARREGGHFRGLIRIFDPVSIFSSGSPCANLQL